MKDSNVINHINKKIAQIQKEITSFKNILGSSWIESAIKDLTDKKKKETGLSIFMNAVSHMDCCVGELDYLKKYLNGDIEEDSCCDVNEAPPITTTAMKKFTITSSEKNFILRKRVEARGLPDWAKDRVMLAVKELAKVGVKFKKPFRLQNSSLEGFNNVGAILSKRYTKKDLFALFKKAGFKKDGKFKDPVFIGDIKTDIYGEETYLYFDVSQMATAKKEIEKATTGLKGLIADLKKKIMQLDKALKVVTDPEDKANLKKVQNGFQKTLITFLKLEKAI